MVKPYTQLNTKLRTNTKNEFKKYLFKLMSNSVYGKTIENKGERPDIHLIKTERRRNNLAREPNFDNPWKFSNDFCAFEMIEIILDKPIYLGFCSFSALFQHVHFVTTSLRAGFQVYLS